MCLRAGWRNDEAAFSGTVQLVAQQTKSPRKTRIVLVHLPAKLSFAQRTTARSKLD